MGLTAEYAFDGDGAQATLRLAGRFTIARLGPVAEALDEAVDAHGPLARIDIGSVERIDTVGAWVVERIAARSGAAIVGASSEALTLIQAVRDADQPVRMRPDQSSAATRIVREVGASVIRIFSEFTNLVAFFGGTLVSMARMVRHPNLIRWNAVITSVETVGLNALAIVGLMCFLIGIVIAQQGAVQLEQFGLSIFTINLVGRVSVRELGLLMTAIMVAGRSGSAFAAQIGTMKLTEEVDAMRTIGISPMEALTVPRVLATVYMMPLLGFYASVMAMLGGMIFCWIGLDIAPSAYVRQLQDIIPLTDFWAMLIKAPVFGLIIAVTGCYHGMQVKANAEEVGLRTTAAVVQGIFLVIVLDAFFAVFFTSIGWT